MRCLHFCQSVNSSLRIPPYSSGIFVLFAAYDIAIGGDHLKKDEAEALSEALLYLANEERKKRKVSGVLPLFAILIAGIAVSFCSFLFYRGEESEGTLTAAKEVMAEFLKENDAIAVFLGIGEENEMR